MSEKYNTTTLSAMIESYVSVCERPLMWVMDTRYETACAYIDGHSSGTGSLVAFRKWLLAKCGRSTDCRPWWQMVKEMAVGDLRKGYEMSAAEHEKARRKLADELKQYDAVMRKEGYAGVFRIYEEWCERSGYSRM